MLKTPLFNKNLEVPTSYFSLENSDQCISKDISVKNLEEHSNIISTGKYDNCNTNLQIQSALRSEVDYVSRFAFQLPPDSIMARIEVRAIM